MDLKKISEDPDVISSLSRDELTEARTELSQIARDAALAVKEGRSENPEEDLAAGKEALERVQAIDVRLAEFAEKDKVATDEADELLAQLGDPEPEEEPEEEAEPEATEEAEPEAAEPEQEEVQADEPEAEVVEPIAASAKPSVGKLARYNPKLPEPERALVASAGPSLLGQHRDGFGDPQELGQATIDFWRSFGSSMATTREKHLVARFNTLGNYKYQVNGNEEHDAQVIDELMAEVRREAQHNPATAALVASGGFCAPAQPVYDFFSISSRDGLISLPTVGAPRGQLTYPVSPSYATIRANVDWAAALANQHTDAEDIAGTTKPNFAIVCPDTTTCAVAAYTTILQFGNFAARFYPEMVAHVQGESATFAAHKVNGILIAQIVALATAMGGGDTGGGGLVNVSNLIGFEAAKYRDEFRMSPNAVLELVAPAWVRDALAADTVARDSTNSFDNALGKVDAVFSGLRLNVQWVQDWQSIADADDNGWRTAADFLLYAPGTFVRMDQGTLDLGIVRDSTLNATNDFQTFSETFEGVCEVGHDAWLIDDVTICPRGSTAARVTLDCNPGFGS